MPFPLLNAPQRSWPHGSLRSHGLLLLLSLLSLTVVACSGPEAAQDVETAEDRPVDRTGADQEPLGDAGPGDAGADDPGRTDGGLDALPADGPAGADGGLCLGPNGCQKTVLLAIPSAENLLFSEEGRLFVSGGTNVFEITADGSAAGYQATPLLDGECNFTGLALRGDVLYAACFSDASLYAARLTATPALAAIHALVDLPAPNGMATGPDGELFVANGPLSTGEPLVPKLVRLELDPADPLVVTGQTDWLTEGLEGPNGVWRRDRTLFITDGLLPGSVKTVAIGDDGQPGEPTPLGQVDGIPDDLSGAGENLLVTLFTEGAVALLGPDGSLLARTERRTFDNPSSVHLGQPPLFAPTDLLVTEKGPLTTPGSSSGNVLSVLRASR